MSMNRVKKSNGRLPKTETSWSGEESESEETPVVGPLPMMVCVVCYNEYSSYSLNCMDWETAVTKDFYVALQIPSSGQDEESVISLPFCPECHSKVTVMFSMHQQLKNVLQSFNCIRNDLAFNIVETIDKNCRNGPLDLIRQQIYERWKDLHTKAKDVGSPDVYDLITKNEYLEPALPTMQQLPTEPKSMVAAKILTGRRSTNVKKDVPTKERKKVENDTGIPYVPKRKPGRPPCIPGSKQSVHTIENSKGRKKQHNNLEMPILIPMAKISALKPPLKVSALGRKIGAVKPRGMARKGIKGPRKGGLVPPLKQKRQILKAMGSKSNPFLNAKTQGTHSLKGMKRKNPVQLANGNWKCSYCTRIFGDLTQAKRHEGIVHPATLPLKCHICPKGFHTSNSLRRHLRLVHEQAVEGYMQCPHCPRSFGKKYLYDLHIRSNHDGENFSNPETSPSTSQVQTHKIKVPMGSPPSPEITDLDSGTIKGPSPHSHSQAGTTKQKSPTTEIKTIKRKLGKNSSPSMKRLKTDISKTVEKHLVMKEENGSQQLKELQNKVEEIEPISKEVELNSSSKNDVTPSKIDENGSISEKQVVFGKKSNPVAVEKNHLDEILESTEMLSHVKDTSGVIEENTNSKVDTSIIKEELSMQVETNEEQEPLSRRGRSGSSIATPKQTPTDKGGVTCPVCGKWYAKSQALGGHMTVHKGYKRSKNKNVRQKEEPSKETVVDSVQKDADA